jgi:transcriptional regulator with XRE-family HTH domain
VDEAIALGEVDELVGVSTGELPCDVRMKKWGHSLFGRRATVWRPSAASSSEVRRDRRIAAVRVSIVMAGRLPAPASRSQILRERSPDRVTRRGSFGCILWSVSVDDLGSFLRSRRAALSPERAGVDTYERRRVPGLRREELAQLAGVSVAYYTRLEQGQSTNASEGVLDALARALQLDSDARTHLHNLARPPHPRRSAGDDIAPSVARLLEAMPEVPACIAGPRFEILAWNRRGHALLAGHLDATAPSDPATRPNMARLVFLDPHTRELFVDRDVKARETVAYLRLAAGRRPGDHQLEALIGELSIASREFATLWAAAPVKEKTNGTRRFAHPLVGRLDLDFQVLSIPGSDGQLMITFTAQPDTPSAAALQLLDT